MPSKTFLTRYFEDAYTDASRKRRDVIDRGLLLIAHVIREDLPTATAITVDGGVLTVVHDEQGTVWQLSDQTRGQLREQTRATVRNTLLDIHHFHSTTGPLVRAGWMPDADLPGKFRIALPDDPDKDQEQGTAPAATDRHRSGS